MDTANQLISIIKSVLSGGELSIDIQNIDWEKLYGLADYHSVANYLVYAMDESTPDCYKIKAQKAYSLSTVRNAKYDVENSVIFDEFEKNGVSYMPLKGYYMKQYYPSPEMRTMCDIDVLIKNDEIEKIESIMTGLGYINKGLDRDDQITYDKPPLCSYEMHLNFVSPIHKIIGGYYQNPWSFAKKDEDNSFGYHMTNEDFFIFQLAHFTKHYTSCGVGLRPVIDIFVYLKHFKDKLDWNYIDAELDKMCMKDFCHRIIDLGDYWFGTKEADEILLSIANQVMNSGIYGSNAMLQTTLTMKEKSIFIYKMKRILRITFPKKSAMETLFPGLKNKPFLLPYYWLKRIVIKLFGGKVMEVNSILDSNAKENTNSVRVHFDKVGLDKF